MSRSRVIVAAAVVGLVLPLAACNGDSETDPSGSPSASASTPSTGQSSAAPSDDASPSVAPASGPVLKMPNATMNAPEGWKPRADIVDFQTEANPPGDLGAVRLGALEYVGPTVPLDQQAKDGLRTSLGTMKRVDDQEIAGVTFYHLAGKPSKYLHLDHYAVRDDGYETTIEFEFATTVPAAEREKTIAEGLASFAWR